MFLYVAKTYKKEQINELVLRFEIIFDDKM